MTRTRAVLWDMDGTLVDSANYHWQAWRDTMASEDYPITHDQFLATFGQRNDSILRQWLGAQVTSELIERVGDAKEALYRQHVRQQGIEPLPGVSQWVSRLLQQGWHQAIASAAPRKNVKTILEALHTADCFEAIVSAEDVHRGKPDPEVFLVAAAKLDVPPSQCIVVEDALHGIEAARAAGMKSIGVTRNGKPLPADLVTRTISLNARDGSIRCWNVRSARHPSKALSRKGNSDASPTIEVTPSRARHSRAIVKERSNATALLP